MKHRARRSLRWFCSSWLILASCTQLRDPNDTFGNAPTAGSNSTAGDGAGELAAPSGSGGSAPSGGVSNGGSAGQSHANAGTSSGGSSSFAGNAGEAGSDEAGCQDATGFHGLGCDRCAATDIFSLENACSTASCTAFDDAQRLTLLGKDGKLPPLPGPSAGGAGGAGGAAGSAGASSAGAGGISGAAGSNGTGKACTDLSSKGSIVYITGSSAAKPFLQQIAQQLAAQNIFIVYESTGSCIGVDAVLNGTPMTTGPTAAALSATYWDSSSSTGVACDLPAEGVSADIGASDVFAQSCSGFELANLDSLQIRDAHGPIQTMTFAVPANSAYHEISAQAAYFAFGFGANGGVRDAASGAAIWNNEDYLYQRSATSGTQVMLAAAIGVPAGVWKGRGHKSSDLVASDLQAAGQKQDTASLALGILAADYIDSNLLRAKIRVLAFQDSSQHCAMFPDSTSDAHDKRNVRDGHYPVWSPLHLLLRVDALGKPLNPANRQAVTDIVGYLSGTKALPNSVQLLDVYAQSGLVPECAMHVTRTKDGGNIVPFEPANPCSCLFDLKVSGATSCTPCAVQGDCKAGETCSQGYCEPASPL